MQDLGEAKPMPKENVAGIEIKVNINVSLWCAIKFRIMGKEMKKAFLSKFEQVVATIESNPESNRLQ
jgi:hypothetical protein